jgi:hypothetical protein
MRMLIFQEQKAKKQGIEVFTAVDEGFIGKSDMENFNYARKINAVLFTHDHHFLNIAKRGFFMLIFTYILLFLTMPISGRLL